MEQKIKEIHDFLCNDDFLYILDKKHQDYINEIYFKTFREERRSFDSIHWHVLIDGVIRFEYVKLISKIESINKDDLINKYFESIADRKQEIVKIAKLVDEYTNMIYKNKKNDFETLQDDKYYYEDDVIML